LSKFRLGSIDRRYHSLRTRYRTKRISIDYRNRARDLWTDVEKRRIKDQEALLSTERAHDREDLDPATHELLHKQLPSRTTSQLQLQVEDDKNQSAELTDLLPVEDDYVTTSSSTHASPNGMSSEQCLCLINLEDILHGGSLVLEGEFPPGDRASANNGPDSDDSSENQPSKLKELQGV
jgi:hypothetical protein